MDLQENTVHSRCHSRPGQIVDKLPLAARRPAEAAGKLDAVGRVIYHRVTQPPQDGEASHVRHQVVVAERDPPLRKDYPVIAARKGLFQHILHVPGGKELPFLDIHRASARGGREEKVGLTAEKRRYLYDVQHL